MNTDTLKRAAHVTRTENNMGIDIITMEDCSSNYGIFEIHGQTGTYRVNFNGSEGPAFCSCPAFKFSGAKQECKHIKIIWEKACLYNPQWHDGKENPTLRPRDYTYDAFSSNPCPCCGDAMVYVRRAV